MKKLIINFYNDHGDYILFLGPVLMIIMFLVNRYKYEQPIKIVDPTTKNEILEQEEDEKKLFNRQRQNRKLVIVLFAVLVATFNVYDVNYYSFAVTYFQYTPLKLTASKASEVITGFTVPYTVFRGLNCIISMKVQPKYILSVHFVITVIGLVVLAFAGNSLTILWVANVIIGIGDSAICQTLYAFAGQYILLTDTVGTIIVLFLGPFNIVPPYLLGLYIKDFYKIFIIVESCAIAVCVLLFVILLLFIRKYKRIEMQQSKTID